MATNGDIKTSKQTMVASKRRCWLIVIGGFMIMATCYTIFVNCLPLFQSAVVGDLGITIANYNTANSLSTVVAVFASLLIGKLLDNHSARILGAASVITCGLALFAFAAVNSLWQLYAICFIVGFAVLSGTRLLVSVLITNWFQAKRGLAISIALSGSGVGAIILMPICSALIQGPGWRMALVVMGIVCLTCSLPLTIAVFANHPSDVGLEMFGAGALEEEIPQTVPDNTSDVDLGWQVVRKSPAFWLLIIGFVMMGVCNGAIIVNNNTVFTGVQLGDTYVTLGGHDATWAANVLAFMMFVVIIGKVSLGAVYDKLGLNAGTLLGAITTMLALVCLFFPQTDWGPILQAVFFGFGTCLGTVAPPIMAVKEYGQKDIGMITGVITAFEMFGVAIGAVVSGVMFDATLSFNSTWVFCLVCTVIMLIALNASVPLSRKLVDSHR